jgi:hypothetical protein
MIIPKWPADLPQTYDVVGGPTYEPDVIETPMDWGPPKCRQRTSAQHKIETRRLQGTFTDAQVGILQNLISTGRRFQWDAEQGVEIIRWSRQVGPAGRASQWTVELVVDIFPSFPPDATA